MKEEGAISGFRVRLFGDEPAARYRVFELAFTGAFLVYMGRNLLTPLEWLTAEGFHLAAGLQRPGAMPPFPLLPVWAVPIFVGILLAAAAVIVLRPRHRRFGFAALALAALYAEGVDSASSFALNRIYVVGFVFLALAPESDAGPRRGTVASVRAFQAMLMAMYFATGLTKIKSGNWLEHSDVLWTHAQSYYATEMAAYLLRNLPARAWTALQYSVLLFELGAPLWFAWRRTRPYAILFGLSFHLGIALMMKAVWVFSLQMAAFYTLFLREGAAAELLRRLRSALASIGRVK
ncbi:MAG: HTTM domain-containing protein [Verrucomicrobiales bacterium]